MYSEFKIVLSYGTSLSSLMPKLIPKNIFKKYNTSMLLTNILVGLVYKMMQV